MSVNRFFIALVILLTFNACFAAAVVSHSADQVLVRTSPTTTDTLQHLFNIGSLGGSSQWGDASGNIYYTGGKVGIGTSNPSYDLTVSSPGNPFIRVEKPAFSDNLTIGISGHTAYIDFSSPFSTPFPTDLQFFTDNIFRMAITESGRVGIGTPNPISTLDVAGVVHASDYTCTDCIDAADLATGSVTSSEIADATITTADINFRLSCRVVTGNSWQQTGGQTRGVANCASGEEATGGSAYCGELAGQTLNGLLLDSSSYTAVCTSTNPATRYVSATCCKIA